MIWIIASVPFWFSAAVTCIMGASGIFYGLVKSGRLEQKEFNDGITGSLILLLASGTLAVLAAKICS